MSDEGEAMLSRGTNVTVSTRGIRIRTQLHDPEGLRDDLLEIHSMAHPVLVGARSVPSRREGTLPEQVLDALDLIDEFVMELTRARAILEPLEALYSDDGLGED